jgi:ABC-2 type transport system permease protein
MSLQLCLWLAPRLYYRGWALAKETASSTYTTGRSLFPLFDRLLAPFSSPVRALVAKDMRTFWRDPAQWSQLIILFGLLVIYIANIQGLSKQMRVLDLFVRQWTTILSFFNTSATCFVLSILTTRFVFPMLSLEGKQYWVIGLAPFPKQKLIWEKYALCLATVSVVALTLTFFSNLVLHLKPVLGWISLATVSVLGVGLTSLAVGLSATFPNFKEDNPARIANGLGGTVTIVLSLCYIAANIALEIPMVFTLIAYLDPHRGLPVAGTLLGSIWPYLLGLVAVNFVVIVLPMRIGLRSWRRLEFHL